MTLLFVEVLKGNEIILPEEEFEKLHKRAFESASKLFQQLLFGLSEVYTPGVKILEVIHISIFNSLMLL